ncbi:response regulator transcription factor [Longirhabdus pacifica]|uniref:response regulator transcription factor n=1 Tax=Longirhabdus pacifica TaxID=2305227 RepID=UPI001008EA83|nr:response regulator transcription factor [Longirhabdus pacifica]
MSRPEKILLVDDEIGILNLMKITLEKERFSHITTCESGEEALSVLSKQQFDVIVLDIMLPDMDGLDCCRSIRQFTDTPILFLTARSSDLDKLTAFGVGGDDYITKPFNPLEIIARIHVQLRRQKKLQPVSHAPINCYDYGTFILNIVEGTLTVQGEPVTYTAQEFKLLVFFCEHPNQVFTSAQLYQRVWESSYANDEKTVAMHISKLRRKIERDAKSPKMIITLRGIGYKFVPPKGEQVESKYSL